MPAAEDPYGRFPEVTARQGQACLARGRIVRPRSYFNPYKGKVYSAGADNEVVGSSRRYTFEVTRLMREDNQRSSGGLVDFQGSKTHFDFDDGLGPPTVPGGHLVWWHVSVADQAEELRSYYSKIGREGHKLASSRIFTQERLTYTHGPTFRYHMDLNDLIQQYKSLLGLRDLSFRIYGTTWYAQEVMYTILVCPPYWRVGMRHIFLGRNERAFKIIEENGRYRLFWRPWCTDGKTHDRVWDHLSIAFLIPHRFGDFFQVAATKRSTFQKLEGKRFGLEMPWR